MGVTEEELEEIILAVQEDANKANPIETAAQAVGVLTTEARIKTGARAGGGGGFPLSCTAVVE